MRQTVTLEESQKLPIEQVVDSLAQASYLDRGLLHRLSDMRPEELEMVGACWPALAAPRRLEITRRLVDITRDNFRVDFSPVFALGMEDAEGAVRVAALEGIWDCTHVRFIPVILALLKVDESQDVRVAAARALSHYVLMALWGQLAGDVLPSLVEELLGEYERPTLPVAVRCALLETLGAVTDDRVTDHIETAYAETGTVRLSALRAMGKSADPAWARTLMREMSSPRLAFRLEAVMAAGELGSEALVPVLAELVQDDEEEIQLAAVIALGRIGGRFANEVLEFVAVEAHSEMLRRAAKAALDELDWAQDGLTSLSRLSEENQIEDVAWENDPRGPFLA